MQQEFIAGLQAIRSHHQGCVATIGSFDGVHLGHQVILSRLCDVGKRLQLPTLVMVFEPQPYEFFSKEQAPARLMRLREKVSALFACGIDRVLCLKFDEAFRHFSADAFVRDILVDKLGVKHLEIGDDFRFGCDRAGDFAMLQQAGQQLHFTVCDTPTHAVDGARVSSTRVRQLLEQDCLEQAAQLLGQPFGVTGRVIYGNQVGRTIDVPTANIGLGRYRSPVQGVYAVMVKHLTDNSDSYGVANVGVKPTITGSAKPLLEVHLLDFDRNIYGDCLRVTFCHKLRREQKFESLELLKKQIQCDIAASREYFAAHPNGIYLNH
jgi:riboflavin kinase / FMN adenylyltransferase